MAGRTGCGKSTLMMALKRIVEPSSGCVRIDGVDIAGVSLTELRSRLALVPQVLVDRHPYMPWVRLRAHRATTSQSADGLV